MTDVSNQKRLAAAILKCGVNRVWIDPEQMEKVSGAITREDLRGLVKEGVIQRKDAAGVSRGRARERDQKRREGRRTGQGSRKGTTHARLSKKRRWIRKIRSQRRLLRGLREEGKLDASAYRRLYRKAKGGEFRSTAHLGSVAAQAPGQTGKVSQADKAKKQKEA